MPKFTLITEHTDLYTGDVTSKTTHEFEVDYLPDVLENIELFLRGAGFVFDGNLDFVDEFAETNSDFEPEPELANSDFEPEPEWHTEEWDTPQEEMYDSKEVLTTKSRYYFDTQRNK